MRNLSKILIIFSLSLSLHFPLQAQDDTLSKKNIIKSNMLAPATHTITLSYERVLDNLKTIHITAFRKNRPSDLGNFEEEVQGWGITPELRFYLSNKKTAPLGSFIAPYITYQQYQTTENVSNTNFMELKSIKSNVLGGGVIFGGQWSFKETISIEVWAGIGYYQIDTDVSREKIIPTINTEIGDNIVDLILENISSFGLNIGFVF